MKKLTNKKGFTLVELVIVIAVIAILAGVLIGTFASVISRANQSKAVQEVKAAVDEAYVEYVAEYHTAPKSIQVTMTNDKFTSVKFGGSDVTSNDLYADFVELNNSGYVELNKVSGQAVYLNWSKTGEETNYSIDTKSEGAELTTKVKTYMQDVVDKAWEAVNVPKVTVIVNKDTADNFSSISFSTEAATPGQFTIAAGYVELGKYNNVMYYLVFTSTTEYTVSTDKGDATALTVQ